MYAQTTGVYIKKRRGMIAKEIILHYRPNGRMSTPEGHRTALVSKIHTAKRYTNISK